MSQFIVQSVVAEAPFQSAYGLLYPFKMSGLLDGQIEPSVSINAKDQYKGPVVGQTITCDITDRNSFGVKIKRSQVVPGAPMAVNAPVLQSMPVGSPSVPSSPLASVPEDARQNSIERQNSLTSAISFCSAKKDLYISLKRPDEAEKQLTGKHIVEVATYFYRYNNGKIIASMELDEVAAQLGYKKPEPALAQPVVSTAQAVFQEQVGEDRLEDEEPPF